jgi:alanyl-tRNA synthetase
VFGEKYPHEVRVVAIGVPVAELVAEPDKPDWDAYSIELCGGTHLASSAEAVAFVFTHEEAVAKGVRRVFALTGTAARDAKERGDAVWARFSSLEGVADLASEVASLTAELQQTLPAVLKARVRDGLAQFQKTLRDREKARGRETAGVLVDEILGLGNGDCIVGRVSEADPGALRAAVEQARGRISDAAILVASTSGDAVSVVAAVPKTLVERGLKAGDWVRETVAAAGGKGGGKAEFAQGGFRDPSAVDAALEAARRMAEAALS